MMRLAAIAAEMPVTNLAVENVETKKLTAHLSRPSNFRVSPRVKAVGMAP
jgi:hypothetical protein